MEACASAHHWARELMALRHQVLLMPPAYVKPYIKRGKTDAADAEAICEAVTRPTMRFVAVKTTEQQAVLMLHKTRDLLVRQRTMLINALRAHLAEYGIVTGKGAGGVNACCGCCTMRRITYRPMPARRCIASARSSAPSPARLIAWKSRSWHGIA
jgi:transposase